MTDNIHPFQHRVPRLLKEKRNNHKSKVLWFTGLSGSGKSTVANATEMLLHDKGLQTYILDGDNVRMGLNKDLGFSAEDRKRTQFLLATFMVVPQALTCSHRDLPPPTNVRSAHERGVAKAVRCKS